VYEPVESLGDQVAEFLGGSTPRVREWPVFELGQHARDRDRTALDRIEQEEPVLVINWREQRIALRYVATSALPPGNVSC